MRHVEVQNITTKIKSSGHDTITERSVKEQEDREIEISQFEQETESSLKKCTQPQDPMAL